MRAFASNIRYADDKISGKLLLDTQVPLLDVGPNGFVGDGIDGERKEKAAANVGIARNVKLRGGQHERW